MDRSPSASTNQPEITSCGSSNSNVSVGDSSGSKPATASRLPIPGVPKASGRTQIPTDEVKRSPASACWLPSNVPSPCSSNPRVQGTPAEGCAASMASCSATSSNTSAACPTAGAANRARIRNAARVMTLDTSSSSARRAPA